MIRVRFAAWVAVFLHTLVLPFGVLRAQSIFTVAGGVIGDGRPASQSALILPADVRVDSAGNVYISDTAQDRVRRVDAVTGVIETIAGNGLSGSGGDGVPATQSSFDRPTGVAIDSDGNVYIADRSNRIRRVDAETGIVTTVVGTGEAGFAGDGGPATEAQLNNPSSVAVDASGSLYIVDRVNNRIRRVDGVSGIITTIAGTGAKGFSGDGGPASSARIDVLGGDFSIVSGGITLDADGNVFLADTFNARIRRIDAQTGVITTVAGGGSGELGVDGSPATQTRLAGTWDVAVDPDGHLFIAEADIDRVRRVDAASGIMTTVAGSGVSGFRGDGGPAIEAAFDTPESVAIGPDGDLYISDEQNNRVRVVDAATQIVDTYAGGFIGDGLIAVEASLYATDGVAIDETGSFYVADATAHRIRRVDRTTRIIETVAGNGEPGFSGDGGPATEASVSFPGPIAFSPGGDLAIGDLENLRVRLVDRETGLMQTIAGNGVYGDAGDGGPATRAQLTFPWDLEYDATGNLYIALPDDQKVRRIDVATGIISTVAGNGNIGFSGDGGPATAASLGYPLAIAIDAMGNLYISDYDNRRIRKVDAVSGIIDTVLQVEDSPGSMAIGDDGILYLNDGTVVSRWDPATGVVEPFAGNGVYGYSGDGGPALDSAMQPTGVAISDEGDVYIGDRGRVRAVFACLDVAPPNLVGPGGGATIASRTPTLSWSPVQRAFAYDVYLGTDSTPSELAAKDLTARSFTPNNLEPGTTYFWRVVAKGDPFCSPMSEASSSTASFTTPVSCAAPAPAQQVTPDDGAGVSGAAVTLSWGRVPGAALYDVYVGTTTPPPFHTSTAGTSLRIESLAAGHTYAWTVVARASCDAERTSTSAVRTFVVEGACAAASEPGLVTPADAASGLALSATLEWTAATNAAGYDLFLGTVDPPPLKERFGSDRTSVSLSSLLPSTTYYWRVRARVDCGPGLSGDSVVRSFTTTSECPVPDGTRFSTTSIPTVSTGQTYVLSWERASGLDALGTYQIERSSDPSFGTVLDTQETAATAATFVASTMSTLYHRVRPISGCSASVAGPFSPSFPVQVVGSGLPNVIFTREPGVEILKPGTRLEDLRGSFTLENISTAPVEVSVAAARIDSIPFFSIRDPLGGDPSAITLEPRKPKTFELRFSGPPDDVTASYQGLVVVSTADAPVVSYAFVNLRVGDEGSAAPEFRIDGTPTQYAFFPGFKGNDANRPPIEVEIRNPGSTPVELAAEIGPEVWLELEAGWNESPIPAGGSRTVKLFTQRRLAPDGSALPRYTYLTLRTGTGEAARLLVQDNDAFVSSIGRPKEIGADERTLIVPEVVSENAGDATIVSRIRLTNLGSDAVQIEIIFTPEGADGFGPDARTATVIIPPNDVAVLSDPLVQVFGLERPARGQVEVRAPVRKLDLVRVEASIVDALDVDASQFSMPIVARGEGARTGLGHRVSGVTSAEGSSTTLVLVETSGRDAAEARLKTFDESGNEVGDRLVRVERYGYARVSDLLPSGLTAGWVEIEIETGGGAVAAAARIEDAATSRGAVELSEAMGEENAAVQRALLRARARRTAIVSPAQNTPPPLVAPYVARGAQLKSGVEWTTLLGVVVPPSGVELLVTFTEPSGSSRTETITVPPSGQPSLAGTIVEFQDVLKDVFGIEDAASGSLTVRADAGVSMYGRLLSSSSLSSNFELVSSISELVVSGRNRRPVALEGLEQSTDAGRGTQWNLFVTEVAGGSGRVAIGLYEAGNRRNAIAVKEFDVGAFAQLSLESVFDEMDLTSATRNKDRTNVLVVVTPMSGSAEIVATAVEIDNETGQLTSHLLRPQSVEPGLATAVVEPIGESQPRRRPVRHTK